ncbi:MAG: hypothetical protein ACKPKO_10445, partial [Candidatus Fonsibacter sp.]
MMSNQIVQVITILFMVTGFFYLLYCMFQDKTKLGRALCDASTQTTSFGHLPNDQLDDTVASLLNSPFDPLTLDMDVLIKDNYNLRLEYKTAGAIYVGGMRRRRMRAGSDLRPVIMDHPSWLLKS